MVLKFLTGPVRERTLSASVDFEVIERGLSEAESLDSLLPIPPARFSRLVLNLLLK